MESIDFSEFLRFWNCSNFCSRNPISFCLDPNNIYAFWNVHFFTLCWYPTRWGYPTAPIHMMIFREIRIWRSAPPHYWYRGPNQECWMRLRYFILGVWALNFLSSQTLVVKWERPPHHKHSGRLALLMQSLYKWSRAWLLINTLFTGTGLTTARERRGGYCVVQVIDIKGYHPLKQQEQLIFILRTSLCQRYLVFIRDFYIIIQNEIEYK